MTTEGLLQSLDEHSDPFSGNSQVLTWNRDINLSQFNAELTSTLPGAQMISYQAIANVNDVLTSGAAPIWAEVSDENPVVIYLSPSTIDLTQVQALLAAHRPDPYYGMSDQERLVAQVKAKLASGEVLTPEELTIALQALLVNS
jgi:hypothetical protein